MFSTPCDPVMSTAGPLRTALLVSACLLLMACDELFPGQRRPVVVMADSTAAQPKRQPSPPRETRPPADSAQVAAAFRQMSQTLRRLVAAEQGFYAENGTYSGDLSRVGFKPVGETVVEFPNNHLGYAYTWYGFAVVAVVMLGFWLWRQR